MDARLGTEVEGIFHFIEGGRHSRLLQALMNKHQKFMLLPRQHRQLSLIWRADGIISTNHEQTVPVLCVFRKH
jgi:hypothetical protein